MTYRRPNARLVLGPRRIALAGTLDGGVAALGLLTRGAATHIKTSVQTGTCGLGLSTRANVVKVAKSRGTCSVAQAQTRITPPPPPPFTHILITRGYDMADNEAATGRIYFTPSSWMTNQGITVVGSMVSGTLDGDGQLAISLAANNDPATFPPATYYVVREVIDGQPERSYRVRIPYNAGSALDLSTLPLIP